MVVDPVEVVGSVEVVGAVEVVAPVDVVIASAAIVGDDAVTAATWADSSSPPHETAARTRATAMAAPRHASRVRIHATVYGWLSTDTCRSRARDEMSLVAPPGHRPEPEPIVRLSTREVYRNAWIHVREDIVRFANGHEGIYGVVTTPGAVGVLPFVDADHVLLVRQFRYVAGRPAWEMPTGAPNPDEALEDTAQRELAEETGHRAGRLVHVATVHTSKSVVDETADLFLAFDLAPAPGIGADVTEQLEAAVFRFDAVLDMVLHGEIVDAMTVVAVLHAARRRSG